MTLRSDAARSNRWPKGPTSSRLVREALLVALIGAALPAVTPGQAVQEKKRVLLIYSHDPNAPGVVAFQRQLRLVVGKQYPTAELYEEHPDIHHFAYPSHSAQLVRDFAKKYGDRRLDAILVEGTPALRFVVENLLGVFPDVPVVFGGAFEPIVDFDSLPPNVVGRRQPLPYASSYTLARALQPDAERVIVIGGSTPTDSLLIAEARRQIAPLLRGVRLELYQDWTYEGLVDSLRRVSPGTVVLLSDFTKDKLGVRRFIPGDLVATLARVASVPVYGIARNWVGDGIVGGGVMDFGDDGARTGDLLVRVLARRAGDPLPASEVAANRMVVDWRQLQHWGLSEVRLPANTEVLFRPLSAWQRYRSEIVAGIALFILEALLIALLLHERAGRLRAQHTLEQVRRQVEHMGRVATLNGLATAVSHDLRQPLTAIRMNAEAGVRLLTRTPPEVDEARLVLEEIASDDARAAEAVEHYRHLLRRQVPISTSVDINAICRETAMLVELEAARRRARVVLQLDPAAPPVHGDPVELQQVLINLTLNALEALGESAHLREIGILTVRNNGDVELHVIDSGPGLSPDVHRRLFEPFFSTKPHGLGMGVTIVRTIVERHHGSLRAENRLEGGAEFIVTLPAAGAPH